MNRLVLVNKISQKLAYINSYLELNNSNKLFDANIISEYFFRDLLNLMYDLNLKNPNDYQKNTPAIDLIDEAKKISIQVTSEKTFEKLKDTIKKFEKNELFEKYKTLELLILTTKKTNHKSVPKTNDKYNFKIKNLSDILGEIKSFEPAKIEEISKFLEKEISIPTTSNNLSEEMKILINLLGLLNQERNENKELYKDDDPKPEYKIKQRFEDYSDFLISIYQELTGIYGGLIDNVKNNLSFDTIKTKNICVFLKCLSNKYLRENNGNPEKALDKLIEHFEEQLNISGVNYARNAILFYLVDEIYKCNVFPNKKEEEC